MMEQAESLIKWAVQSENERTIAAGLKLTKHALLIEYGALNADPWLFNVQNGTIDLRTGTPRGSLSLVADEVAALRAKPKPRAEGQRRTSRSDRQPAPAGAGGTIRLTGS